MIKYIGKYIVVCEFNDQEISAFLGFLMKTINLLPLRKKSVDLETIESKFIALFWIGNNNVTDKTFRTWLRNLAWLVKQCYKQAHGARPDQKFKIWALSDLSILVSPQFAILRVLVLSSNQGVLQYILEILNRAGTGRARPGQEKVWRSFASLWSSIWKQSACASGGLAICITQDAGCFI